MAWTTNGLSMTMLLHLRRESGPRDARGELGAADGGHAAQGDIRAAKGSISTFVHPGPVCRLGFRGIDGQDTEGYAQGWLWLSLARRRPILSSSDLFERQRFWAHI